MICQSSEELLSNYTIFVFKVLTAHVNLDLLQEFSLEEIKESQ